MVRWRGASLYTLTYWGARCHRLLPPVGHLDLGMAGHRGNGASLHGRGAIIGKRKLHAAMEEGRPTGTDAGRNDNLVPPPT